MAVEISLNGGSHQLESPLSIADLLRQRAVDPRRVAVELNELLVPRERHGEVMLREGDRLEVVTLVGGG